MKPEPLTREERRVLTGDEPYDWQSFPASVVYAYETTLRIVEEERDLARKELREAREALGEYIEAMRSADAPEIDWERFDKEMGL